MSELILHDRLGQLPIGRPNLLTRFARWFARRRYGRVPTALDAYAHCPSLLVAAGGFELVYERAHAVEARVKALAELKVAALVGCPFCLDMGSGLARGKGISERQVRELAQYATSDAYSTIERLALDLATAMTETPVRVPEPLFAAVRAELGPRGAVELTGTIAWENFRARSIHALGLQAQGFSEGAVCALPESRAAGAPAPAAR